MKTALLVLIFAVLFFSNHLEAFSKKPKSTLDFEVYKYGEKVGLSKGQSSDEPVDIHMARREYEIFSVVLPEAFKDQTKTAKKKETPDLTAWIMNPNIQWSGAQPKVELTSYLLAGHRFSKSSWQSKKSGEVADIPVPLEWLQKGWITVPEANVPSKPSYLFELLADASGPAGDFKGTLSFEWNQQTYKLPIHLKVYDTVLPKKFDLATSFGFAPWDALRKHYGKWHKDNMALYEMYQQAALDHRIDLHKLYVKYPDKEAADPLADGPVKTQTFLGQTDKLYKGELTSSGLQMGVTDLPVSAEYKKVKNGSLPKAKLEAFWKKMNATVLKHDLKNRSFVYFVDEPKKETLQDLGEDLRAIRKWAPDLRFLVTSPYRNTLEGAVNLWCVGLSSLENPAEKPSQFYVQRAAKTTAPESFWIYVGCNAHGCSEPDDTGTPDLVIDRASAYQRAFPWLALHYKAEGILYYDTVYGYSQGTADSPWTDAFSFTGYGEGNLFYPCTPSLGGCKEPRVLSSLRLKILRDGLEDVQLLRMAMPASANLREEMQKVVAGVKTFKKSTEDYEKTKRIALKALSAR